MQVPELEAPPGSSPPASRSATTGRSSEEQLSTASDRARAQAQFTALTAEHLDGLYRSALRLTRKRAAAEDLVQDVMLKAWRSFHTFQEGTTIRPWLHRILMNAFFDAHRKQTREPEVVEVDNVGDFYLYEKVREGAALGEAGNPEIQVLDQIMDAEVRESLEALPLQYRSAVLLADVQGFSYKEIADILGIPVGTVMSRLSRGRHMLQRRLWEFARDRRYIKRDKG
jgi:RNA polymerase sigma-70 factor, ECF subfamily